MPRPPDLTISRTGLVTARKRTAFVRVGASGPGIGDISGPGSSTDNAVVRWNGTAGTTVQNSGVIINDDPDISGIVDLTMTGALATPTSLAMGGAITGATNITMSGTLDLGDFTISEASGVLTLAATTGQSEDLAIDLAGTANTIVVTSTTGADKLDLTAFTGSVTLGAIAVTQIDGTDSSLDIKGQANLGGSGGIIIVQGGVGTGGTAGGPASLIGGTSSVNGLGGAVAVTGGAGSGSGAGGNVTITGGTSASGTVGSIILAGNSEDLVLDFTGNLGTYTTTTGLTKLLYTSIDTEIRGAAAAAGTLTLSTAELTVVDGDILGRIDFQAPLEADGDIADDVVASIMVKGAETFGTGANAVDLFIELAGIAGTEDLTLTSAEANKFIVASTSGITDIDFQVSHLHVQDRFVHSGDVNTYVAFTDDRMRLVVGAVTMVDCFETTQDTLGLGVNGDVDMSIGNDGHITIAGDTGNVVINAGLVDADFTVNGDASALITCIGESAAQQVIINGDSEQCDFFVKADTATIIETSSLSAGKLGFFGASTVVRGSNFVQTYTTASQTHAALTNNTVTDSGQGTASTSTLLDVITTPTPDQHVNGPNLEDNFATISAELVLINADIANIKNFCNGIFNDFIDLGLIKKT